METVAWARQIQGQKKKYDNEQEEASHNPIYIDAEDVWYYASFSNIIMRFKASTSSVEVVNSHLIGILSVLSFFRNRRKLLSFTYTSMSNRVTEYKYGASRGSNDDLGRWGTQHCWNLPQFVVGRKCSNTRWVTHYYISKTDF